MTWRHSQCWALASRSWRPFGPRWEHRRGPSPTLRPCDRATPPPTFGENIPGAKLAVAGMLLLCLSGPGLGLDCVNKLTLKLIRLNSDISFSPKGGLISRKHPRLPNCCIAPFKVLTLGGPKTPGKNHYKHSLQEFKRYGFIASHTPQRSQGEGISFTSGLARSPLERKPFSGWTILEPAKQKGSRNEADEDGPLLQLFQGETLLRGEQVVHLKGGLLVSLLPAQCFQAFRQWFSKSYQVTMVSPGYPWWQQNHCCPKRA